MIANHQLGSLILIPANVSLVKRLNSKQENRGYLIDITTTTKPETAILLEEVDEENCKIWWNEGLWIVRNEDIYGD